MVLASVNTTACLLIMSALLFATASVAAESPDFYKVGDEWVYDVTMEFDTMTLDGVSTYRMDAVSTVSVAGVTYEVYEMVWDGDLSIDGEIESIVVEGDASISGTALLDVEDRDRVRSETNLSMEIEVIFIVLVKAELWKSTVTTYSPPVGFVGDLEDKEEGESWTVTFTEYSETMSYDSLDDEGIQTDSNSSTVTRTYTYIGKESVTVPAGTFDCQVIQIDDGDGIETDWYCEEVGANVKEVYESGMDETGEMTLTSYIHVPSESDGDDLILYLTVGAIAAVVVIVAVVAMLMLRRRPNAPQMMPAEPSTAPAPTEPQAGMPPAKSPPENLG